MKNMNLNSLKPLMMTLALLMITNLMLGQSREKRDVSNFTALSVSSAFVVEISVGSTESLEIEVEDRFMDDVITEVRGGRLVIKMNNNDGRRRKMNESPRAYLTVKSLDQINASGAVVLRTMDILKGDKLDVELSGATVLNLEIDVKDLYVEASGACVINMEGSARNQTVKTSGATNYRAYDLESETAEIKVSGAGSARVYATDKLDVRATGASTIRYKGGASVNSNTSGASSVKKG